MSQLFKQFRRFSLLFLASFVLCLLLETRVIALIGVSEQPAMQVTSVVSYSQLVQQGIKLYQAGKFSEAIAIWQQALLSISSPIEIAAVKSNLAAAYRQIGQLNSAIAQWNEALQIYRHQNNHSAQNKIAGILIEQGQAYSDLGQHKKAIQLLQSAVETIRKHKNRDFEAAALGALGNAYHALGDYDQAISYHDNSLNIARSLNNKNYITTSLNNLGNVYISRSKRYSYQTSLARKSGDSVEETRLNQLAEKDTAAAIKAFEQSVEESTEGGLTEVKALLNLNYILEAMPANKQDLIAKNRERAIELLEQQPDSRDKSYALINLAIQSQKDTFFAGGQSSTLILEKALAAARNIGDARAESFALGSLGQIYEQSNQYDKALELTRQAQFAAQNVNAADSLYRWQWQTGRLLKVKGEKQSAIASYEQAIATLQNIRSDLIAANKDLQFDFRDSVEPVYRELMQLLLDNNNKQLTTTNLEKVVKTLELLKLAELQNYFGDECVQLARDNQRETNSLFDSTAIIYSVILQDRTEMILRLPNGNLTSHIVPLDEQQMQQKIDQLRFLLEKRSTDEYLIPSQQLYNLLISPLESELSAAQINTLVFIKDGVLRQVPMAALHDGKQFLVQKYAIANAPSLSLTTHSSTDHSKLHALILGLTVERPPFAALTNVASEVASVKKILGGTELIDKNFTINKLEKQLQNHSYQIVHMATHGKFGVDAESTFLLGFDARITLEQIDNILRSRTSQKPVELLTLSACQTAAGDNRAALGIAGVAVRAGVKSALASLWFINDQATVPLIEDFYTQLRQPNITKAEALRFAQLKMIADVDYNHPAVWASFILIGNWL